MSLKLSKIDVDGVRQRLTLCMMGALIMVGRIELSRRKIKRPLANSYLITGKPSYVTTPEGHCKTALPRMDRKLDLVEYAVLGPDLIGRGY